MESYVKAFTIIVAVAIKNLESASIPTENNDVTITATEIYNSETLLTARADVNSNYETVLKLYTTAEEANQLVYQVQVRAIIDYYWLALHGQEIFVSPMHVTWTWLNLTRSFSPHSSANLNWKTT